MRRKRLAVTLLAALCALAAPAHATTVTYATTLTATVTECEGRGGNICPFAGIGQSVSFDLFGSLDLIDPEQSQALSADWQDAGGFNSLTITSSFSGLPTVLTTNFGTGIPPILFEEGNEIAGTYLALPGGGSEFMLTNLTIRGTVGSAAGTASIVMTNTGGSIRVNWDEAPSAVVGFSFATPIGVSAPVATTLSLTAIPLPPSGMLGAVAFFFLGAFARRRHKGLP